MRRKLIESLGVVLVTALFASIASLARPSWDVSENERNSFAKSHAMLLSKITAPLRIEAYLAPEDPRRFDLEQQTFSKLRRTMPDVTITYVSSTATGLFEQAKERYGEVSCAGQRSLGRATTTDAVLDALRAAGAQLPLEGEFSRRGHLRLSLSGP
jgi:hypothetical protein